MFEIVTKERYWQDLDDPVVDTKLHGAALGSLKYVQDAWILGRIGRITEQRILEVGGGFGRVLRTLEGNPERWNLDVADGPGRNDGRKHVKMPRQYTVVPALLGEFSPDVPEKHFDIVFSISVIEHVPLDDLERFWADHARILKPGGRGFHAIDVYLGDVEQPATEAKLDRYLETIDAAGLQLIDDATIERPLVFRSRFASAPDLDMRRRNQLAPSLARQRLRRQAVSLAVGIRRPD